MKRIALITAGIGVALGWSTEAAELLTNPSFEPPVTTINSTNSFGTVSGTMPNGWYDNSRGGTSHTNVTYSLDPTNSVAGNALKTVVALEPGFTTGYQFDVEQSFQFIAGRALTASVWLRSSSNVTGVVGMGLNQSPYTVLARQDVSITTAWQKIVISVTPNVTAPARFFIKCKGWKFLMERMS